jgi:hypothetical protein
MDRRVKRILSTIVRAVGWLLGLYLVVRAVAEPFVIDVSDPSTYRNDWGGPSLLGVLTVHCGPGILAAAIMAAVLIRRLSRQTDEKRPRVRSHG